MNRLTIRHGVAFALFGIAVSYLSAWTLTLWSPYLRCVSPPTDALVQGMPPTVVGPDGNEGYWSIDYGPGVACAAPMGASLFEGGEFRSWRGEHTPSFHRAGWPLLAIGSVVRSVPSPTGVELSRWQLPIGEILRRGLQTGDLPPWMHARPGRRLGLLPLFPGFLVNASMCGAAAVCLRAAAAKIRHERRRRRARCTRCNYDLNGLPATRACPECGERR
jgi:hypothetical protein